MILSKTVKVKIGNVNLKHYKELGYKFNHIGDVIDVKVEDLLKGSEAKIEVLCDMCHENKMIVSYGDYNRAIKVSGSYVCKQCVPIKRKKTMQEKYGVSHVMQSEIIKEKSRQTNLAKYGVENYTQTKEYKEKSKQTYLEKYNAEHSSKCQETKDKRAKTNLIKYGFEYATQNQGVKDKTKITVNEKYGVDNVFANEEIIMKIHNTMYQNGTCPTSRQQEYLNYIYNGILNLPFYCYNLDIYLPNDKIVVEYNGGGHSTSVKLGRITQEEFDRKEIIRNQYIKQSGMKRVVITSCRDKLPSDIVLMQMLDIGRNYFFKHPNHSWIEFNIDLSIVRNAENKDGDFYDYGKLRKIKDSDLFESII